MSQRKFQDNKKNGNLGYDFLDLILLKAGRVTLK